MLDPKSKMPKVTAKAKAIDQKKDKILYAGLALLAGLLAMAALTSSASARVINSWAPHHQGADGMKVPFLMGGQKLSH